MEIALYCRSGARSGATRKSGGAERSGERALQKNDGAERGAGGRGAGSGGYRIRLERGAAFSPAPLRSHAHDALLPPTCFMAVLRRATGFCY